MSELKVIYKPLAEVQPYEKNPRRNDEAVRFVKNSIQQFGFRNPIIIDSDGVIVAGHTRYKAAVELGMEKVPCLMADDLTPEQIKAFRIADNKTAEKAVWDNGLLSDEISDLLGDFSMTDFGFGDFELSILTEDYTPEPYDTQLVEQYSENSEAFLKKKRIIIGYTDDDAEKLAKLLGLDEIKKVMYDINELA